MKKNIILTIAIASIAALTSCEKVSHETEELGDIQVTATIPTSATKAVIGNDGANVGVVRWTAGDHIAVFDGKNKTTVTLKESDIAIDGLTATFTIKGVSTQAHHYIACCYPANMAPGQISLKTVRWNMNYENIYNLSSHVAHLGTASGTIANGNINFQFRPATSLLRIVLPEMQRQETPTGYVEPLGIIVENCNALNCIEVEYDANGNFVKQGWGHLPLTCFPMSFWESNFRYCSYAINEGGEYYLPIASTTYDALADGEAYHTYKNLAVHLLIKERVIDSYAHDDTFEQSYSGNSVVWDRGVYGKSWVCLDNVSVSANPANIYDAGVVTESDMTNYTRFVDAMNHFNEEMKDFTEFYHHGNLWNELVMFKYGME